MKTDDPKLQDPRVKLALEITAESRKRMNTYTDEERAVLEKGAREYMRKHGSFSYRPSR